MTTTEQRSAALQIQDAAISTLALLITWYYALQEWHSANGQIYLIDILHSTDLRPSKRTEALEQVKRASMQGFCKPLGIQWTKKDLVPKGIDPGERRAEINVTIDAITQMFSHFVPSPDGEIVTGIQCGRRQSRERDHQLILDDGQTWDGKIIVTPSAVGDSQKLEFRLFREPTGEAYRTLHLFVEVR